MKKFSIIIIFFVISQVSQAQDATFLIGNWRISELTSIIHMDNENFRELNNNCYNKTVKIEDDKISIFAPNCDYQGCDSVVFAEKHLRVIDTTLQYFGQEIYDGNISKTFLNFIHYNAYDTTIRIFTTNCLISWGDETLIIIPIEDNSIIFLFGSYIMKLKR